MSKNPWWRPESQNTPLEWFFQIPIVSWCVPYSQIADVVKQTMSKIFKDNLVFGFIFGSFATKLQNFEDLDVMICLKARNPR